VSGIPCYLSRRKDNQFASFALVVSSVAMRGIHHFEEVTRNVSQDVPLFRDLSRPVLLLAATVAASWVSRSAGPKVSAAQSPLQDALHVVALVLQVRHERRYRHIRICLFLPCYSSFMAKSRRVTGHGLGTRKILTSSFEAV
jgi:hypothetical protein